jgi:DNA-binding HxlR family transcriptional regulator
MKKPVGPLICIHFQVKSQAANTRSQVVYKMIPGMTNDTNNVDQPVTEPDFETFFEKNNTMNIALDIMGGKWKLMLLNKIREECPMRFGVLRRKLPHITQATLTAQLKQLERDGILLREAFAESPPRVEYKLTEIGKSLIPIMDSLCAWGENYARIQKGG